MIRVIQSHGVKCHKCPNYIHEGTLCLYTRNWQNAYYYCWECAKLKGEYIDPKTDFVSFKRDTSPYSRPEISIWDELGNLNYFPIC